MNLIAKTNAYESTDKAGRINGVVDVIGGARIAGWAIDRADETIAVSVDIHVNGVLIGSVVADNLRTDLKKNGIGTGCYGFKLDLDDPVDPDLAFSVNAIARAADGTSAPLRKTGRAALDVDKTIRAGQRAYLQMLSLARTVSDLSQQVEDASKRAAQDPGIADSLARIELVQVRLETMLADWDQPAPPPQSKGLKRAVFVALAMGVISLSLGLFSLFSG